MCMIQCLRERQVYPESNFPKGDRIIHQVHELNLMASLNDLFFIETEAWIQQCKQNSEPISGRMIITETLLLFFRGATKEKNLTNKTKPQEKHCMPLSLVLVLRFLFIFSRLEFQFPLKNLFFWREVKNYYKRYITPSSGLQRTNRRDTVSEFLDILL